MLSSLPGLALVSGCTPQRSDGYYRARPGGETLRGTAVAHGNFQQLEASERSERNTVAGVAIRLKYLHRRAHADPNRKAHSGKARLKTGQRRGTDIAHQIAEAVHVKHLATQLIHSLARLRQLQTRQAVDHRRPQR